MASPTRADELIDLLRKSRVLDDARLDDYLKRSSASLPAEAPALAKALVRDALLTPFQAEQLMAGKYRGFELGKYKILERIGSGGMGQVYLAEHAMMRRRVAIKVLPAAQSNNADARDRFLREARAAGALAHPNIVRAYDVDQHQGIYFLVMEYVDGRSLQEIVARFGPLSPERAAYYLWQSAVGLQHAHEAGLVHRDIKPANLLLDRDGIIKVLDLGLARFFNEDDDKLTQNGGKGVLGTADYLAPEQAIDSHEVDIRADIYSLGTTAYFLLTGKPPFGDGSTTQKLLAHQLKEPTPIREQRPEVPQELIDVLAVMMRKDPDQRYQTPADVVAALDPWAQVALPPPPPYEMPRLCPALQVGTPGSTTSSVRLNKQMLSGLRANVANSTAGPKSGPISGPITEVPNPADFGLPMAAAPEPKKGGPLRYAVIALVAVAVAGVVAFSYEFLIVAASPELRAARISARAETAEKAEDAAQKPKENKSKPAPAKKADKAAEIASGSPKQAPVKARAGDLIVGGAGGLNSFPDLQSAVARARAGDRIIVRASSLAEPLVLNRSHHAGKNISILADSPTGLPVIWQPPKGHPADKPFIDLTRTEDVQFNGFEFNGLGRSGALVALRGDCPGTAFQDCTFRSFTRVGLDLVDAGGESDRPIRVSRCRFTDPAKGAAAFVNLAADPKRTCKHIELVDNRLESHDNFPFHITGGADNVLIENNRVHRGLAAVRIDPIAATPRPVKLVIRHNTFAETAAGIKLESEPAAGSGIVVQKNLFYRSGNLTVLPWLPPLAPNSTTQWVWANDVPEPLTDAPAGTRYLRRTFDAGDKVATAAVLEIATDDECTAWLNGKLVAKFKFLAESPRVPAVPVASALRPGKNVLALEVTNPARSGQKNPGLVLARLTTPNSSQGKSLAVITDPSWKWAAGAANGWQSPDFDDAGWANVKSLSTYAKHQRGLVWESELARLGDAPFKLFPDANGNVRTNHTNYSPFLGRTPYAYMVNIPTDTENDTTFLRYASGHDLAKKFGSPGVRLTASGR